MNWSRALYAFTLASYLWLCFCWFDHDLGGELADTPVMIPLGVLGVVLTAITWFYRGNLRLGTEGKITLAVFSFAFFSRLPFLASSYGLFSSDAAAQGIMALHIAEGKHHPIFLYKWSYVGSLKAHLTALLASILGDPVVSFASSAVLAYAAFAAAVYFLARSVASRTESMMASLLVILAPGF
ncbi:MAG TPA: hypothetical protein VEK15_14290, partial [Vicinamibacteria bacterium]|nr:hypothetical protein [Vicinamibacteria bacterium]